MKARALRGVLHEASGVTLIEVLIAAAVFTFVALAFGSLFLAGKDGFEFASAEASLQSQGTLIEEELRRHILRASALQVSTCRPDATVTIPDGQSIIYQRRLQNPSTLALQSEFWCIYRYRRTSDLYALLWRCQVAGLTPPQTCTAAPAESLLTGSSVRSGLALAVSDTHFSNTTFAVTDGNAVATTVDVRFDLDLLLADSGQSLLTSPRRFGFNTTIRN